MILWLFIDDPSITLDNRESKCNRNVHREQDNMF
jgi:hypothetical protein